MLDPLKIAGDSANCLADLLQNDGQFRYRFNVGSEDKLDGYNVLRHAGAVWALLDVYEETGEKKLLDTGRRATSYMLDAYLRFYRDYQDVCICEDNKIKLGGNALAVLALLGIFKHTRDHFSLVLAEKLTEFMVKHRTKDGDLIHKRYFQSGKVSSFRSSYYTGEALLAVLLLYEMTNDNRWLSCAEEMETTLCAHDYGVTDQSHWMLYFLGILSRYDGRPVVFRHAAKIARHILDHPHYLGWQRSTPIACRSEGLLAFIAMSAPTLADETLQKRALEQVKKNLEIQLTFRQPDGCFIRGGTDRRRNEVRIDYLQHNISSFLYFARFSRPDATGKDVS